MSFDVVLSVALDNILEATSATVADLPAAARVGRRTDAFTVLRHALGSARWANVYGKRWSLPVSEWHHRRWKHVHGLSSSVRLGVSGWPIGANPPFGDIGRVCRNFGLLLGVFSLTRQTMDKDDLPPEDRSVCHGQIEGALRRILSGGRSSPASLRRRAALKRRRGHRHSVGRWPTSDVLWSCGRHD